MARLNEPAQPASESIDALKRRFVRQNREIAKANSVQSLRIRNLEGEVSRLLGENVSLREQIIKLHYEVENNASRSDSSKIDSFKTRLEAKIKELEDLVLELGNVQQDARARVQQKRKSLDSKSSPKRSPNQRIWKNTQTLSDLMGEADGRLPPILEDKQFPRQTLESEELHRMLGDPANLTDSPDLGPPPVAHFEEGDPIKFEVRDNRRASKDNAPALQPSDIPLSANLETRRRRREITHLRDTSSRGANSNADKPSSTTQATEASSQPFKAGAKRKLNVRDEEEQPHKEVEKDDFQFNRKEAAKTIGEKLSKAAGQKVSDRPPSRTERIREASKENSATIPSAGRRALGPKSANSDPQSPAKLKTAGANDKPVLTRETLVQRIRDREQQKEKHRVKMPVESVKSTLETIKAKAPDVLISQEPETPAPPPLDLFSPTSTEPSAHQEGRGDTPPPPDLGPDTGTGSFGRASRRSRGSVSYAEPNLRDKMRRPTKELVDAVGAEERARQARADKMDNIEPALANIKVDEESIQPLPNWKTKPVGESNAQKERQKAETTSPLGKKAPAPASDLPASVITDQRRRTSKLSRIEDESEPAKMRTSGAASTIAALAKPKRNQDQPEPNDKSDDVEIQPHSDRTSIFDFTGSSPDVASKTLEKEEASRSSRSSRRHSSVPALSDHGKGSLAISRRIRRESMA